ncbi:MAG: spore coat U domain-containing protein [Methylocystis sp.]|nr:spore coat U domain-containing protein [Methylocystis sp.]
MRTKLAFLIAAGFLLGSGGAYATTTVTSTFQSRVTIAATCVIGGASTLDFGSPGVLGSNVDQTSTIQVTCTNSTAFNIGLDKGTNGASVTTRLMKGSGSETIQYSLFTDSSRLLNWGNTAPTDTDNGTGSGSSQSFTVYGRIPIQTTPSPDTYTDTITVAVTY